MNASPSPERIAGFCRGPAQQVQVRVISETGSTNADLLAELPRLSSPTLLIAENQTGGRGRAGRTWHSSPGASLTFSLAWKCDLSLHDMLGMPLAVGVAIADALAMFNLTVQLKWPNDVLLEGKKLAGILIETSAPGDEQRHGGNWAVIGVGINMAIDAQLAAHIGRPAAAVPWLAELDRDMLMATLLNHLADTLAEFERFGFDHFVDRWNALHAYGSQVVAILDNGVVLHEGRAQGVDAMGRFLIDTRNGRVAVMAGDVSLRAVGG